MIGEKPIYTEEDLARVRNRAIPRHVAIIPDGNRRWAKEHAYEIIEGHRVGSDNLVNLVDAAEKLGIKVLTIYAFSTENWGRPSHEIDGLMGILEDYLRSQREAMVEQGVKLSHIGELSPIPDFVKDTLALTEEATKDGKTIDLVLAINYGGRNEICRAVRRLVEDCQKGLIHEDEIDESLIDSYLDTAPWGNPDLMIRTGGEHRISNFLLWQSSYSEFIFEPTLWPDFGAQQLLESIVAYQQREQRLGK